MQIKICESPSAALIYQRCQEAQKHLDLERERIKAIREEAYNYKNLEIAGALYAVADALALRYTAEAGYWDAYKALGDAFETAALTKEAAKEDSK